MLFLLKYRNTKFWLYAIFMDAASFGLGVWIGLRFL
jgi:hypothetical protein